MSIYGPAATTALSAHARRPRGLPLGPRPSRRGKGLPGLGRGRTVDLCLDLVRPFATSLPPTHVYPLPVPATPTPLSYAGETGTTRDFLDPHHTLLTPVILVLSSDSYLIPPLQGPRPPLRTLEPSSILLTPKIVVLPFDPYPDALRWRMCRRWGEGLGVVTLTRDQSSFRDLSPGGPKFRTEVG